MSEPRIKHTHQVSEEEEDGVGYAISREEWNEGHIIELGSARIFVGLDAAKDSALAVEGNLYFATDTPTVYAYTDDWVELPLKGAEGPEGSQGIQGEDGPPGLQGDPGAQGPEGLLKDPDYDSGWLNIAQGEVQELTHSLGGTPEAYLISLKKRDMTAVSESHVHWHLNEASGIVASDSSINGRDGTLVNMDATNWVPGKLNNGLQFDGVTEHVICGNIAGFEYSDSFSFEFWIKTSASIFGYLLSKAMLGRGWGCYVNAGKIGLHLLNSGTYHLDVATNALFNDNLLHHVIITYNGNNLASGVKIYVDGNLRAITVIKDDLGARTMLHGGSCQINGYNGINALLPYLVDEVVIYEKELTLLDVASRWNASLGTEIPLDLLLPMGIHSFGDIGYFNLSSSAVHIKRGETDLYALEYRLQIWKVE